MKRTLTLTLALALAMTSCAQWGKKIKGNGEVITQERSVGDYSAVALSGPFDVDLVQGREGNITIQGESNLLEYLITEVRDGTLEIKTERGHNLSSSTRSGIRITVPIESIEGIGLAGSGDIKGHFPIQADAFSARLAGSGDIDLVLDADRVDTALSGSGDITLSGQARTLEISVSGSGDVMAFGLEAASAQVNVSGSADVEVTATEGLVARISGSGDVRYRGNPVKVDARSTGSGSVNKD